MYDYDAAVENEHLHMNENNKNNKSTKANLKHRIH